jgi:hypothetical protein
VPTLETLATISAIGLLIQAILLTIVVLVVLFVIDWKGMGFVLRKTRQATGIGQSIAVRVEETTMRAGHKGVSPSIWLYSRAAWVRGFARSLWLSLRG